VYNSGACRVKPRGATGKALSTDLTRIRSAAGYAANEPGPLRIDGALQKAAAVPAQ
jgi:hypothetical protein